MKHFKKALSFLITNMLALIVCFSATFLKPDEPLIDMEPIYEVAFPFIPNMKNGDLKKILKNSYNTIKNLDEKDAILYYHQARVFFEYLEINEFHKVFEIRDYVVAETIKLYGENSHAEDSDAFRHLYITSLLAHEIGEEFSIELMKTHEITNTNILDTLMDTHNNEVALKLYHLWCEKYKPAEKSLQRESLRDFLAHCVEYGDIYNILKFDNIEEPTHLVYTSKKVDISNSYTPLYEKLHLTHNNDHYAGSLNKKEIINFIDLKGHSFETNKTSCTCHNKKYFVLSPDESLKRAFHEYKFNETISEVEIKLSLVSSLNKKDLKDVVATIDYLDENNNWITCINLLDILKLNVDYSNLEGVRVSFPKGTKGFRIYISTENFLLGDICICEGDVDIFFDTNE